MSGIPGLHGIPGGGPPPGQLQEPKGYSVVSALSSAAIVFGVGTAPLGLILVVVSFVGAHPAGKRLIEANPELLPQDDDEWMGPKGRPIWRVILLSLIPGFALCAVAFLAVRRYDTWTAAIWPALVSGALALAANRWLRRAVASAYALRNRRNSGTPG